MAGFDGAGNYVRNYNWALDAANAIPILAARFDTEDNGFAAGLSNVICRDGQSVISANIPFNGHKLIGLGDATAATDALNQESGDARYALATLFSTGSFTATLTGMTSATTGTINYRIVGGIAHLWSHPGLSGTSNTTSLSLTGLPAALQPAHNVWTVTSILNNGSVAPLSTIIAAAASSISFQNDNWSGITVFTASGTKGLPIGWQLFYNLN